MVQGKLVSLYMYVYVCPTPLSLIISWIILHQEGMGPRPLFHFISHTQSWLF